jgi:hypothetical protein
MAERTTIGFDRRIDIEWLDAAAGRVAAGDPPAQVREFLWNLLEGAVGGDSVHSARGKTLTVLMRIWVTVPSIAESLRDAAIKRIPLASPEERLAMHWAMSIACYPFFSEVTAHAGKLLTLHEQVNVSQIIRRMTEIWGDRSTLPRAVQRVLRSIVQWGTLREGTNKGIFIPPSRRIALSEDLAELLAQAILVSHGRGMSFWQVSSHPALFPFDARLNSLLVRKSNRLRISRQGDETDFVELET